MNHDHTFLILEMPCEQAIAWLTGRLAPSGLQLHRTFDLQVASGAQLECSCPHHGTELCDCQMVVMLVYAHDARPASLVAHSHHGRTYFALVNNPQQPTDHQLETTLKEYLYTPPAEQESLQVNPQPALG